MCEIVFKVTTNHACAWRAFDKRLLPVFHGRYHVLAAHSRRIRMITNGVGRALWKQDQIPGRQLFDPAVIFQKRSAADDEMELGKSSIRDRHLPMTAKVLLKIDRAFETDEFQNIT